VLECQKWENLFVRSFDSHACTHVLYPALPIFSFLHFVIFAFSYSQLNSHQRRRSHQQQQPAAVAVASTGPLSVQILNYEASLLQQQVC
jgi:hypothetical protein